MQSFDELKKRWDDHVGRGRYHPGLAIKDAGLVLGAETILVRMGKSRSGAKALAVEADRERLLSLLGVSYRDQVPPGVVKNIENASEQWRRGDKALAHIHLAFARLPRLESANDAFPLYLAGALLDDGLPPREMLAELGLGRTMRQLDKFDPDQPRAPAGSGRESGQWTKDGGTSEAQPPPTASPPKSNNVQVAQNNIKCSSFIAEKCKGSIMREFPSEYLDLSVDQLLKDAQGGVQAAVKGKKLFSTIDFENKDITNNGGLTSVICNFQYY